jgi:hypothetical protein
MKKILISFVLSLTLFNALGCRHVNSSNPKVIVAVRANDAANLCKSISDGLVAADKTLDGIQTQEPDYYSKVKPWLIKIATLNDVAAKQVLAYEQGNTTSNWQGTMQQIAVVSGQIDPIIFGFKNPTTQTEVKTGFTLLQASIASVIQLFGNK